MFSFYLFHLDCQLSCKKLMQRKCKLAYRTHEISWHFYWSKEIHPIEPIKHLESRIKIELNSRLYQVQSVFTKL